MPEREVEFSESSGPGDCSVEILGFVYKGSQKIGLTMELGSIDLEYFVRDHNLTNCEKKSIMKELIALLERLHSRYNIIHGDIKLPNLLYCTDGRIRFCDFEASRRPDDDPDEWYDEAGMDTDRYRCPTRPMTRAPTKFDDWYAMALTVWSVYVEEPPFKDVCEGDDIEDLHKERRTVDVSRVEDEEARDWIRSILRQGGALV
ncbi:hypothetical protein AA313_de0207848 [Arthrobotrys entomopaga]|nr:hypothetical protein AA313_de0207848 [Arthrobotrys entomopaga]